MDIYLSPAQVCDLVPGLTENLLAQMRYRGDGPPFIRASPRTVVYSRTALEAYLGDQVRQSTADLNGRAAS